jgi:hypothetical protein
MTNWKLPPPTPGEGDRGRGLTKPKDLSCDKRLVLKEGWPGIRYAKSSLANMFLPGRVVGLKLSYFQGQDIF